MRADYTGFMPPRGIIFDYVDGHEPLLAKMATGREAGSRALGYEDADLFSQRLL
jgi:hypothetical protein